MYLFVNQQELERVVVESASRWQRASGVLVTAEELLQQSRRKIVQSRGRLNAQMSVLAAHRPNDGALDSIASRSARS